MDINLEALSLKVDAVLVKVSTTVTLQADLDSAKAALVALEAKDASDAAALQAKIDELTAKLGTVA